MRKTIHIIYKTVKSADKTVSRRLSNLANKNFNPDEDEEIQLEIRDKYEHLVPESDRTLAWC
jgi:hypothetical protein